LNLDASYSILDAGYRKDNVVSKVESLILGIFFGYVPLVFCFLTICLITFILFEPEAFGPWMLWSLVPGMIIDTVFLKKWVRRAYQISNKVLAPIYLFYSIVALGLGMGVPIFNFALGITAGIYSARRMHFIGADEEKRNQDFKKTAAFCAAVLALMCCLIALWAIAGEMIGSRFETPVLSFTFTVPVFVAVVLAGGLALVLLQYWLTSITVKLTFKLWP